MSTAASKATPLTPMGLLCGWVAGTALQLQQAGLEPLSHYLGWLLVALALSALWLVAWRATQWPAVSRSGLALLLLSAAAGAALGFGLTGTRAVVFERQALSPSLEGRDITVVGVIKAMPQRSPEAMRFQFQVESAWLDQQAVVLPPLIAVGWYSGFSGAGRAEPSAPPAVPEKSPGVNLAGMPADTAEEAVDRAEALQSLRRQPQPMNAGERWQMMVRLKAPHGNSNPHGFDYELWLWEQGVQATGSVRTGVRTTPPEKVAESEGFWIERARQQVRKAVFERVADRQLAGVLAALVMGDQHAIERADWDVFRATGVAHLMSISGLHITLFAWLASRLLGWLWRRSAQLSSRGCLAWPASSVAAWGGLALAVAYAAFSGWGVPAQRTVWMLAVIVALRQSGRQWAWPHVWLLAMAVVVALDPWALLQAGFWLSFVAVGVLFAADPQTPADQNGSRSDDERILKRASGHFSAFLPSWRPWLAQAGRQAWRLCREQWVITLALTPLTLLLFNQVSLVGLLANALAIPWVTLLVTPLALLGVIWAPLWDLAAWCMGALTAVLQWLALWPGATLSQAAVPLWGVLAGMAGGLMLVIRWPWHWRVLGLPLVLPLLLWQPARPAFGTFELLGADVGQGNAVLVRTARHSLLFDAGPRFSRDSDAGHRVLVPLLRALGEQLDVLILSHRDADHVGGAAAVLAMQPQASLLSSIEDSHELQQLRPATRCQAGQRWHWDGVDFEVLHPAPADYAVPARPNTMSCVLRVAATPASASSLNRTPEGQGRSASALLTGDIEVLQEQSLLRQGLGEADFLLMPHHGSKTSSSASFLDTVQPRVALAQAGYRNRFSHPAAEVLARYDARAIAVVASAHCGAMTWRSDLPGQWRCQRQHQRRYWHHRPPQDPAGVPLINSQ